jgi:hypothetical protein
MFRWRTLPRLLAEPEVREREVHGSESWLPEDAAVLRNRPVAGDEAELREERRLFDRDLELELALGFDAAYASRGGRPFGVA